MSLVGKQFPDISVKAMDEMGDAFKLNVLETAKSKNQKVLLFWYPKDFTFVCPTELHAFQEAAAEFKKRNTVIIGASCDTAEVHFAWLSTAKDNGGIEGVKYPLLADSTRVLSSELGILDDEDSVTYRATYLLDENGVVFHESVNHMPIGRNVHEYLRIIDAFAHVQKHGEVCPANWEEGKDAMNATSAGVAEYLKSH
ncbi:MAG: peroxiredoxin [Crocinitomicaceae bacterium]|jgi:peroxiredoxin 2/4|nr:peroxiredoxin [Crocinitomicaceae bacterium]MDP4867170.1 peroxiredoxin [Crocinitomicaceae bacterium]MDP5011494.1 peroxiredoxin [Crocinitomicaceae bacterium]